MKKSIHMLLINLTITLSIALVLSPLNALASPQRQYKARAAYSYSIGYLLIKKFFANNIKVTCLNEKSFLKGFTAAWHKVEFHHDIPNNINDIYKPALACRTLKTSKIAYFIGYAVSLKITEKNPEIRQKIQLSSFIQGFQDGYYHRKPPAGLLNIAQTINSFIKMPDESSPTQYKQLMSYTIGYAIAKYKKLPDLKAKDIDLRCYLKGFRDATINKPISKKIHNIINYMNQMGTDSIDVKTYKNTRNQYCYAWGYMIEKRIKESWDKPNLSVSIFNQGYVDGINEKKLHGTKKKSVDLFIKLDHNLN